MSAPAASWCDPAGERLAQVKGSVQLGSECCVATGDSGREAYTAIAWGVGLSHERSDIAGAESFYSLEGNMCSTVKRDGCRLAGVEGHITCKRIASEAGRSRVWPERRCSCRPGSGRRAAGADEARTREAGPRHNSHGGGEQSGAIRRGAGGAKGGDQGECGPATHAPDAEPEQRVTGAGTHTEKCRTLCRQHPRWKPY